MGDKDDRAVPVRGPGQALFEFVRLWARRATTDEVDDESSRLVLVTQAVGSASRRGPATINAIAQEMGLDQSGASRLVKSGVAAGHLTMDVSQRDARQRVVSVTETGMELVERAHEQQEQIFRELAAGWSKGQRTSFTRAMQALLDRSHDVR